MSNSSRKCVDCYLLFLCRSISLYYFATLASISHCLKDNKKSLAACVNNACLFKNRQKLGSDSECLVCLIANALPYIKAV